MSSVADHLLIVSKGKRARIFPLYRPSVVYYDDWVERSRTHETLVAPGYYNLLPCSRFTPLRSDPPSTSCSLVHTLDLIGYQISLQVDSNRFSSIYRCFFSSFLLNSAIGGQISSSFNLVYFSPISVLTLSLTKTDRNNRIDARGN